MGIAAVIAPFERIRPALLERLSDLGFDVEMTPRAETPPTVSAQTVISAEESGLDGRDQDLGSGVDALARGIRAAIDSGTLVSVVDRGEDAVRWRRDAGVMFTAAASAAAADGPFVALVIPATAPTRPGPVAIVSPAGSAASYELMLGAVLAARSGLRVEHLNGRSAAGSALGSAALAGSTGRAAARASVVGWHEGAHPRPERALHTLITRPSIIVVMVPPGSADAGPVIADHPDADIVLVFDTALPRHGAAVAQQVAAMVELAFGVELTALSDTGEHAPVEPEPTRDDLATPTRPSIRASDVVHVRLTDVAVELTNRTTHRIGLTVDLGSVLAPDRVLARFQTTVAPGETHTEPTGSVAAVAGFESPIPVLRHWSHGDAEVFEGGQQRLIGIDLALIDEQGEVSGRGRFDAGNGLEVAVTARSLAGILGLPHGGAPLPEPVREQRPAPAAVDLLMALEAAAASGAAVLARRSSG